MALLGSGVNWIRCGLSNYYQLCLGLTQLTNVVVSAMWFILVSWLFCYFTALYQLQGYLVLLGQWIQ